MKTAEHQKLRGKLAKFEAKYASLMKGRMVPTPKALRVHSEIQCVRKEIERLDRDAAERLALAKAPIDDVLGIIAIPLLADVMNDIVADVDGTLRRNGCQETVFSMYTSQISKAALAMVDTLSNTEEGLPKLLDVDDTLVDSIRKKLMSFIRQRLNITA